MSLSKPLTKYITYSGAMMAKLWALALHDLVRRKYRSFIETKVKSNVELTDDIIDRWQAQLDSIIRLAKYALEGVFPKSMVDEVTIAVSRLLKLLRERAEGSPFVTADLCGGFELLNTKYSGMLLASYVHGEMHSVLEYWRVFSEEIRTDMTQVMKCLWANRKDICKGARETTLVGIEEMMSNLWMWEMNHLW